MSEVYDRVPTEMPWEESQDEDGEEMFFSACCDSCMPKSWVIDCLNDGETLESLEIYNCERKNFSMKIDGILSDHYDEYEGELWYIDVVDLCDKIESLVPPVYKKLSSKPPLNFFISGE